MFCLPFRALAILNIYSGFILQIEFGLFFYRFGRCTWFECKKTHRRRMAVFVFRFVALFGSDLIFDGHQTFIECVIEHGVQYSYLVVFLLWIGVRSGSYSSTRAMISWLKIRAQGTTHEFFFFQFHISTQFGVHDSLLILSEQYFFFFDFYQSRWVKHIVDIVWQISRGHRHSSFIVSLQTQTQKRNQLAVGVMFVDDNFEFQWFFGFFFWWWWCFIVILIVTWKNEKNIIHMVF